MHLWTMFFFLVSHVENLQKGEIDVSFQNISGWFPKPSIPKAIRCLGPGSTGSQVLRKTTALHKECEQMVQARNNVKVVNVFTSRL